MPLFNFRLRPLIEVQPWTRSADPGVGFLSWFGLTDGEYWIDLGPTRVFQYTPEALAEFRSNHPLEKIGDHVDYEVGQLHQDLVEILPDVLAEVPAGIHAWIQDCDSHRAWRKSINWALGGWPEDSYDRALVARHREAAGWMGRRSLDTLYLEDGQMLRLWRHNDVVHFLHDHFDEPIEGASRWTATAGVTRIPVDEFLREVESFHRALIDAMAERVRIIVNENPFPGVQIDLAQLQDEQCRRAKALANALQQPAPPVDWDAVLKANELLRRN